MPHTFTSLQHPLEKLLEAEHFLGRLLSAEDLTFQFELNTFLSAGRSVTFVLQKTMADVPGFDARYARQRERMKEDAEMRFFLDLRNISQKQRPGSYIYGGSMTGGKMSGLSVTRPVPALSLSDATDWR